MDDNRYEDREYDPSVEPESSSAWLNLIAHAEKGLKDYQERADNIDKLYADLNALSNITRDRQFAMFWANVQVVGPSIYSRPPIPVVVPRFRERRAIPRTASEILERATCVLFEQQDIDGTMRLIRDDVTVLARGVAWLRYEDKSEGDSKRESVCIEHVDRKDFLHEPARKWQEVGWVARRAWMTHDEIKERFGTDAADKAAYSVQKNTHENGFRDSREKAGVWEVWSRSENRVVWVTEGVETLLDSGKPHLKLEGFFPCPKPAYSTVQRGSLVPVPDMVFYKDQLEEINDLTARISAITTAIKVRGFYNGGAGDIADAIEKAIKSNDDNAILIPVSSMAAFGSNAGDPIVWLPIDVLAKVVGQLIELRRQLIDDVYQITGLSDIMRGSTNASETATAQQLKSQYGSIRVRDRQDELVRVARDITRIAAEIIAEHFDGKTLLDMSQMELPTDADIKRQIAQIETQGKQLQAGLRQQLEQAQRNPELAQQAQANPEAAQQFIQQAQQQAQGQLSALQAQADQLRETVTIDQVMKLLREQRTRPFVLDIETDSTITPDENAQKERATEFLTSFGTLLGQAVPAIQQLPQIAPLMSDMIKYAASQFRAGRQLDTTIDEFAERMKALGEQPPASPQDDAAQQAAQAEQQRAQAEQQGRDAEMQMKQADMQMRQQEAQAKAQIEQQRFQAELQAKDMDAQARMQEADIKLAQIEAKAMQDAEKHAQDMERGALELRKLEAEIARIGIQADATQQSSLIAAKTAQGKEASP